MNNSVYTFGLPDNEPVKEYLKGSKERIDLDKELLTQSKQLLEIPLIIGGKEVKTDDFGYIRAPHNHSHILAKYHKAGKKEIELAIEAALQAHLEWASTPWRARAAILLRAADLITTKYRAALNAATMLGQSKNIYQSEIDAVCETADFIRFNTYFASQIYANQPISSENQINSLEYRALEGFVFAVTPFNFTSIAANLNLSPVMMGNTTLWKPASTAVLSNYYLMKIFIEAGIPAGVINFLPSSGAVIGSEVLSSKHLAGIHFTGSNNTFNTLWKDVAKNLTNYRSYPRLVGETGGKDFIFVHPSANVDEVVTASYSGAFEFQGQKCSAASRVYLPHSLWSEYRSKIVALHSSVKMGVVTEHSNFINAVIDESSFDKISGYIDQAKRSGECEIIFGGECNKESGWFIEPTLILTQNPKYLTMEEEIFGPVLTIYLYPDDQIEESIKLCDSTSPYGLTGAIFGRDRVALEAISQKLKYAAGNFYINDKPTGAVVGKQPFGGSRASGTNDKAGGIFNLIRWTSPRAIKETLIPPTNHLYSYMK